MASLAGKVAIVTGATSGIGERIAERFVEAGATVVATGRRMAEGQELAARCGDRLSFHQADVGDEGQVKDLVDRTIQQFGQIDCLVNNAGIGSPMVSITALEETDYTAVFRTNVLGPMMCMKHVLPHMIARRSGSIVNMGSMTAHRPGVSGHIYSASKAALVHLTRCVTAEVSRHGIRVNSISPGAIVTGIFAKTAGVSGEQADLLLDQVTDLFVPVQPIPRAGVTDDVADAAMFLASDASSFVSGHDLVVDGGFLSGGTLSWDGGVAIRAAIAKSVTEFAKTV